MNSGVKEITIPFYIRKPKISPIEQEHPKQQSQEQEKQEQMSQLLRLFKEREIQSQEKEKAQTQPQEQLEQKPIFRKFQIKLLSLRANSNQQIRRRHYQNAIDSLNQSLQECLQYLKRTNFTQEEDKHSSKQENEDEIFFQGKDQQIFKSKMSQPWDSAIKPPTKNAKQKQMRKIMIEDLINSYNRQTTVQRVKEKALYSIYRSVYNIPSTIQMRYPGSEFRMVVNNATALKDFAQLLDQSLDPRLIYFHQNVSEKKIQQIVQKLKGSKNACTQESINYKIKLKEIGKIMHYSEPPINLFFDNVNEYSITKIPGFVVLPCNFSVDELLMYLQKNYKKVKIASERFLEKQLDYEKFSKKFKQITKFDEIRVDLKNNSTQNIDENIIGLLHFKKFYLENKKIFAKLENVMNIGKIKALRLGSRYSLKNFQGKRIKF